MKIIGITKYQQYVNHGNTQNHKVSAVRERSKYSVHKVSAVRQPSKYLYIKVSTVRQPSKYLVYQSINITSTIKILSITKCQQYVNHRKTWYSKVTAVR